MVTIVCTKERPCSKRSQARTVQYGDRAHNFDVDGMLCLRRPGTQGLNGCFFVQWSDGEPIKSRGISREGIPISSNESRFSLVDKLEILRREGYLFMTEEDKAETLPKDQEGVVVPLF